ncbi:MAG: helix-turn-helix domain-containing protein [Clostridia bacterium]|nr:helix-turn-helix domain-containing protein [Clostridia bacterium]
MSLFGDIKTGLDQAIEYEKGNLKTKTTTLTVEPIENFKPEEIRSIRMETGLTQVLFAKYMGVSAKTVEAWEAGRNHPEGAACRLLAMTRKDPTFPQKSGIVTKSPRS